MVQSSRRSGGLKGTRTAPAAAMVLVAEGTPTDNVTKSRQPPLATVFGRTAARRALVLGGRDYFDSELEGFLLPTEVVRVASTQDELSIWILELVEALTKDESPWCSPPPPPLPRHEQHSIEQSQV